MRYENTIGNPSNKQHMTTRRRPGRPTRRDDETTDETRARGQIKRSQCPRERDEKKHEKNTSVASQAQRDDRRDERNETQDETSTDGKQIGGTK